MLMCNDKKAMILSSLVEHYEKEIKWYKEHKDECSLSNRDIAMISEGMTQAMLWVKELA